MKKYPEKKIIVPRFTEANGFYTTKKRSSLMGKIKSKNTKPEIRLRKALWHLGFRYRKNIKFLPGQPDLVFSKFKLVVFVDGEFWHGYNWEVKKLSIKSNREFWIPKIERNMQRDKANNELLEKQGWHVMRFWANDIKNNLDFCVGEIVSYLEQFPQ